MTTLNFSKIFHPKHILALAFLILSMFLYLETTYAHSKENSVSEKVVITEVDTSKLTSANPYITVRVENLGNFQSDELQVSLKYLLYPKLNHGKSWKEFEQLNYTANFVNLEAVSIQNLESGKKQEIVFMLDPNEVAKLHQVPTVFISELSNLNSFEVLSYQVSFSLPNTVAMVHATALAFDNPNYSSGNLAPQIQETINGIIDGSKSNLKTLSIVLGDDYGEGDTKTYFIYGGIIIPDHAIFSGLPDKNGVLSRQITEYDMGDGDTLGGYLQWVRQITNNQKLTFSFYGHGGALMPDISPGTSNSLEAHQSRGSQPVTLPSWIAIQPSWIAIQPSWIAIQPSWIAIQPAEVSAEANFATDAHPVSLISIKDLATALKKGSNNGENPIEVVDLVHCFSLSIEEVYELAPYTETIIGSANYHFFDARMPGQALKDLNANQPAKHIATSMMTSYDQTLPAVGYPRTMAVIDSHAVADIKTYWDETSGALLDAFSRNHQATRTKLQQAYFESTKYDSTSCNDEFGIGSPDALVDFYEFSNHLITQFQDDEPVANAAQLTASQIDSAVISVANHSGQPWFSNESEDVWQFSGHGLSIYADLVGQADDAGRYALSWQSAFYNRLPHENSPNPFDFVVSIDDSPTWADVILKSWEGFEVSAQSCVISVPLDHDEAEVSIENIRIVNSDAGNTLSADFYIDRPIGNLNVLFEITREGNVVFTQEVHTGWLEEGSHNISTQNIADTSLFEQTSGDETINVTLDPHGYIAENDKSNNKLVIPSP